jgi:uncharacterized delta-60 repeat protein
MPLHRGDVSSNWHLPLPWIQNIMKNLTRIVLACSVLHGLDPANAQVWQVDPSFGDGGQLTLDVFTGSDELMDVEVLPDDRILVLGYSSGLSLTSDLTALYRLNTDGTPDPSFGDEGLALAFLPDRSLVGRSMVAWPDGHIVVVGGTSDIDQQRDAALVRFRPNGTLDPLFGDGGIVQVDLGDDEVFMSVLLDADGSIVAAGRKGSNALVMRFDEMGMPVPDFGEDGAAMLDFGPVNPFGAVRIAQRADGNLLVMARVPQGFRIARLNSNGELDITFGENGSTFTSSLGSSNAFVVLDDGRMLVGGGSGGVSDPPCLSASIHKLLPDGTADSTFAINGVVLDGVSEVCDVFFDLQVQEDGRILVTGTFTPDPDIGSDLAVLRYSPDGSRDPSFGDNGLILIDMGCEAIDVSYALGLQANGDIIVGGVTNCGPFANDLAVVRLYPAITTSVEGSAPALTNVSVHPNPAATHATLVFDLRNAGVVEWELFDMQGRRQGIPISRSSRRAGPQRETMEIAGLASVIYTLVLTCGAERSSLRIIKE